MAVPPTGKSQDYPWTNSMAMKPVNGTPHLLDEPPPSRPQFANASAWPPRVLDLAPPTPQKQIAPIQLGSRRGFPLHSTISRHWSLVKQHIRRKLLELSATSMEPNNPIQVEAGRTPSRSMAYDGPTSAEDVEAGVHPIVDAEEIDEVVVDRPWSGEQVELLNPDDHCNRHTSSQPPSLTGSAAAIHNDCNSTGALTGTHSQHQSPGIWACYRVLMILRLKLWPYVMRFFSSKFEDEGTERSYQQEMWCQSKKMCLWSSTFFIFNWVVEVVFLQRPLVLADKIFYYAVSEDHALDRSHRRS
ncbi:hypothetical protein AX16_008122 [Volvariella volvacea WC 439]|nr:hypothetical protein AX16_008122 [Volvariella volvacea WC 439]